MKSRVYLAGPMGGLTFLQANIWRKVVNDELLECSGGDIVCFSPLRGAAVSVDDRGLLTSTDPNPTIHTTNRAIMTRDYTDCVKADLIFANFLGAKRISIGTVMEIGFAHAHRIPVVAVIEPGNPHDNHPMMEEAFTYKVDNLDAGIGAALTFLLP